MKHLHIRPISKVNKNGKIIFYQSLVCFQYRVIHSIMVLNKVFRQYYMFHSPFWKTSGSDGGHFKSIIFPLKNETQLMAI